eukprot:9032736-Lingulodinium_polyedra.AAC.1
MMASLVCQCWQCQSVAANQENQRRKAVRGPFLVKHPPEAMARRTAALWSGGPSASSPMSAQIRG